MVAVKRGLLVSCIVLWYAIYLFGISVYMFAYYLDKKLKKFRGVYVGNYVRGADYKIVLREGGGLIIYEKDDYVCRMVISVS